MACLSINLEPGTPEWLARMTASKVAAVMGVSPFESRFSLWHRMAGLIEQVPESDVMRRGHYLEPAVAQWFTDQHPELNVCETTSFYRIDRPWQVASPDRLIVDENDAPQAVLEIKTSAVEDEWGEPGTDQIPPYYRCQVVWQMDTLDLRTAYVAVLLPRLEFREYRVDYNAAEAQALVTEAREFLDSLPGGPSERRPNLDAHAETYAAVRQLHPEIDPTEVEVPFPLAYRFADACRRFKEAEQLRARLVTEMADHMGTAKTAVHTLLDDTRIKLADRRAKNGGIPYLQAASKLPDLKDIA